MDSKDPPQFENRPASAGSGTLGSLISGRAAPAAGLKLHLSARDGESLHDKMRQAYWWIINNAVLCPYYDIQFGSSRTLNNKTGDALRLPEGESFSSFVLIPMLTLFTCRRALMIGGPGRGKTTSAFLMALLAGMPKEEVRKSVLRGHPQLTITDLLGAPMPADLLKAQDASEVKVSWRKWITSRVKIIDEYNRIPTKTQSALLSLLAEGYAEMLDQSVHTGASSWFLTANDDAGGGTFQVIDALKDRIDVVVRAVPFHSSFIHALLGRIESGEDPTDLIPQDVLFTPEELAQISKDIESVEVPIAVLDELGFFLGQLDFCRQATSEYDHMSKDTLHLSGRSVAQVCTEECPLDKKTHLCSRTENGVSARSYLTCLHFAKALAYFRGNAQVEWEDLRQMVPWVLHEKIKPNPRSAFFEEAKNRRLLLDRVHWIRSMMDDSSALFKKAAPIRELVQAQRKAIEKGLEGVSRQEAEARMLDCLGLIRRLHEQVEISGYTYEWVVELKSLFQRYQNYIHWLNRRAAGNSPGSPSP
jgi:MoxR-like ATPase